MKTMLICIPSYSALGCLDQVHPEESSLAFITGDYSVQSHLRKRGFRDIYFIRQNAHYLLIYQPITVITKNTKYPTKLYELIGAEHVLYSKQGNLRFLLQ
ncbi:hypothetical protein AB1K32_23465 [Metabacillus dongyingensis]|uniref:hypothetical protein n=1 Tax=Metabacillus dongyingensis TaxID=2874282 RepID=UPI003B8B1601